MAKFVINVNNAVL